MREKTEGRKFVESIPDLNVNNNGVRGGKVKQGDFGSEFGKVSMKRTFLLRMEEELRQINVVSSI